MPQEMRFGPIQPSEASQKSVVVPKASKIPEGLEKYISAGVDILDERRDERRAEMFRSLVFIEGALESKPSDKDFFEEYEDQAVFGDMENVAWERRLALLKLINFITEFEYPDNPANQAAKAIEFMGNVEIKDKTSLHDPQKRRAILAAQATELRGIIGLARTVLGEEPAGSNPFALTNEPHDTIKDDWS